MMPIIYILINTLQLLKQDLQENGWRNTILVEPSPDLEYTRILVLIKGSKGPKIKSLWHLIWRLTVLSGNKFPYNEFHGKKLCEPIK